MGASLASSGARSGGRRRRRRTAPMSEINVTPFVDVMLVLLIIFMVSAPLLTVGVPVDLPQSQANPLQTETEPLTVSVNGEGQIFLQETEVTIEELVPRLTAISAENLDTRVFVRADRTVDYGNVMRVMGRISSAGYTRIGLVSETEQEN
ncbi:MAG: protein TolR [Pseudomonadota bacterium]